jgi:pyruvate dehydrogenase E1 component alpha subunit
MGTAVERASAVLDIQQKAEGYEMKNGQVDGMDVQKVYEATKEAIEFVRKESQPYLLEVMTYRYRGHSMGDPERYRKPEEVKKWQETDPIGIFRKHLLEKKTVSAKALDEIDARVEEEVNKAVEFAETSPEPTMEELFTNVYVEESEAGEQQSETSPSESLVAER